MKNHYFGAMKPNKETNKTVKVGKTGNVIFWIVVTLLSLGLLFSSSVCRLSVIKNILHTVPPAT